MANTSLGLDAKDDADDTDDLFEMKFNITKQLENIKLAETQPPKV